MGHLFLAQHIPTSTEQQCHTPQKVYFYSIITRILQISQEALHPVNFLTWYTTSQKKKKNRSTTSQTRTQTSTAKLSLHFSTEKWNFEHNGITKAPYPGTQVLQLMRPELSEPCKWNSVQNAQWNSVTAGASPDLPRREFQPEPHEKSHLFATTTHKARPSTL